ncbi:MAG TPA: DUF1254 domain-containing protein [Terriglobales bacterium]
MASEIIVAPTRISEQRAHDCALDAYIFGYPLVLADVTRQIFTNTTLSGEVAAPINHFAHMRAFPDDTTTFVTRASADALQTSAFLDLSKEPMVLSVPEMRRRYYFMEMLDAWTNVFACLGTRTTGSSAAAYAIVGPCSLDTLPDGVSMIQAPTNLVWLIGRIQTTGSLEDYATVHAFQDGFQITPLSAWGRPFAPPENVSVPVRSVSLKTSAAEQVASLEASAYFKRLCALMKDNPLTPQDGDAAKSLAAIGIVPGHPFDIKALGPTLSAAIERGFAAGHAKLLAEAKKTRGRVINGWEFTKNLGRYGTDYLHRATTAVTRPGASLTEDTLCARACKDADGTPLDGDNRYQIHFAKGQLPPVSAYWSISMYDSNQSLVRNPINRFAIIGDREKVRFNDDGSLTLYIQTTCPEKQWESNWLPAPKDAFRLAMRLYWPKQDALDGNWKPPQIQRFPAAAAEVA